MNKILIIGNGVFAQELSRYLKHKKCLYITQYNNQIDKNTPIYLGSGKPYIKIKMYNEINNHPIGPPIDLSIFNEAKVIGCGSILAPGSVLAPNSSIGKHVLINYNATIGHDTTIEDFVTVSPNASIGGNCLLKQACFVGANASIKEKLTMGENTIIGMGTVVLKDVPDNHIAIGNPAQIFSQEEWKINKIINRQK